MSRARTLVVTGLVCATAAAAFFGWSAARGTDSHPHVAATMPAAVSHSPSTSANGNDRTAETITKLEALPLAQPGSEISVGLPQTLQLDDVDGQVIYASVTMSEIQELPADQASALLAKIPALTGYSTVYEMPVSLTVLGVVTDGGADVAHQATGLTASVLGRFSIAPHPGTDPLPVSNTLSDGQCHGSPATTPATVGQTVQWCIHAFGRAGDPTPAAGRYQAPTGSYQTPVSWASQAFGSTVVIP